MKALQLVNSLNSAEQSAFDAVIKNKGRKPLYFLWKYLLKYEGEKPEKTDMYLFAFKTKYNSKKDYLLRNELRILSDELTNYIIQKDFDDEIKQNPHFKNLRYLKALRRRNLDKIFLSDYDKIAAKANDEMQIDFAEEMAREKMLVLYYVFDSQHIANEVYKACEEYVEAVAERAQFSVRLSEFHRDIARRRWELEPIDKDVIAPKARSPRTQLKIETGTNDKALIRYYSQFTRALHCEPEERIEVLNDALMAINQCNFPGIKQWRLKAGCLNFLGITYYQLENIDLHFDMFKQSLQLQEENGNRAMTQLDNYLSGLLRFKRIDEFWSELERFKTWFTAENLEILNGLIQYAHEVTGSYDDALVYLNKLPITSDDEYLTVKVILVHIYYQMQEFDLMISESTNALQFLRSRDKSMFRYQCNEFEFKLAALLARYHLALDEERPNIVDRIQDLMSTASDEVKWHCTHTFFRSKWVFDEIEKIVGESN